MRRGALTRWVRVQWEDYPFAKFNKHLKLLAYSDDEYAKLLEVDSWTRVHPFLVFKADRLLYHSTLGLRVIQQKKTPPFLISSCTVLSFLDALSPRIQHV